MSGESGTAAPAPEPDDGSPPAWERTVYNMLFRFLGNRRTAKRLTRALAGSPPPDDRPATIAARDLARAELSPEEYARSPFARGREILSEGPDLEVLPRLPEGFDVGAIEKEIKDVLPREHLGVLELVFVDRRPIAEVAELAGVSPEYLVTFVAHLVDVLGDVSSFAHDGSGSCPHPLRLIRSQIEHALGFTDRQPAGDAACASCRRGMEFTDSVLTLFATDSRILSLGDDRVLRRALEAPRVKPEDLAPRRSPGPRAPARPDGSPHATGPGASGGPYGGAGVAPKTLPEPNPAAWRLTVALMAGLVLYGSYATFSTSSADGGGSDPDSASFRKGLKTLRRDSIGTYSDPSSPSREMVAHSTIQSSPSAATHLTYHSGIQVELAPASSVTVQANRIRLNRGRMRLRTGEASGTPFFIEVAELAARIKEGDALIALEDGSALRFALKSGVLDVKDARKRRYRLEAANVMRATASGSYVVEESTAADLASLETAGSGGAAAGTAAAAGADARPGL
jgi:hypothetical protein